VLKLLYLVTAVGERVQKLTEQFVERQAARPTA
jgi:hypothetical protein